VPNYKMSIYSWYLLFIPHFVKEALNNKNVWYKYRQTFYLIISGILSYEISNIWSKKPEDLENKENFK